MRLTGKVAIVTGAAQGFGAGIARLFAEEGAKIVACDLNEAGAKALAAEIGNDAIGVACDVSKLADAKAAVKAAMRAFGRLDIVVNNAGTSHRNKPMLEVSEEEFDRIYAVNVKSIYNFAIAAVPEMAKQGAGISSISVRRRACARAPASPGITAPRAPFT